MTRGPEKGMKLQSVVETLRKHKPLLMAAYTGTKGGSEPK